MFIDPHCSAMCLQQSRSASVISAPGIRHAIAGKPSKTISSRTLASWRTVFTYQVVYAQFGTTATISAVTAVTAVAGSERLSYDQTRRLHRLAEVFVQGGVIGHRYI